MKKLFSLFAVLLASAMVLTACGGGAGAANLDGRGDNTVVIGTPQPQQGLFSPLFGRSVYDMWTVNLVFDGLFTYDLDGNFVPAIAADMYTVSEDGLTYTVTLRDDVFFSNGNKLTADDVVFTYNILGDPSYNGAATVTGMHLLGFDEMRAGEADHLAGVVAIDDYTVSFTFTSVRSNNYLSLGMGIFNRADFEGYTLGNTDIFEDRASTPVGTGTYMLQSWSSETGAVHVPNPYSWRTDWNAEAPEMIIIRPINDQMVQEEFLAGNIDVWTNEIQGHNIDEFMRNENLGHVSYDRGGFGYLAFNTVMGATADVNVRQALMYSFDRNAANDSLFPSEMVPEGIAFTPTTLMNPISPMSGVVRGDVNVPGLNTFEYNPARAIELLEEAGWTLGADGYRHNAAGERLEIRILSMPDHSILETLVPIWDREWTALGIHVQVATLEFNAIVDLITDAEPSDQWNVFFLATSFTSDDMFGIRGFVHSSMEVPAGSNFSRINDAEIDRLIELGEQTLDSAEALEIAKQLVVRINELVPMQPIYVNLMFDFYNANQIAGFRSTALTQWHQTVHTWQVD